MSRPGDWYCGCGENNFKNRTECRKCGNIRTTAVAQKHVTELFRDWHCSCGEMNFESRSQCRKCGINRIQQVNNTVIKKHKQEDWKCECGEINFKNRTGCRKCGNLKNDPGSNSYEYTYEEGDWKCRCGEMNFKTRDQCRKCHTVKNDIVRSTNEKLELDPYVCSICMTNPKNMLILKCKHLMCCSTCVTQLRKKECPICRVAFTDQDLVQTFV